MINYRVPATLLKNSVLATALLAGCFSAGYLTIRSPLIGYALVGAIGCLIVYVVAPDWMAWLTLFTAFATFPASVPGGKLVGGTIIYIFEVFLILALVSLVLGRSEKEPIFALPWIYLLFAIPPIVTGLLGGNDRSWIISEARPFFALAAAFTLTELLIRGGLAAQAAKVVSVMLWFSTLMILASALAGLQLQRASRSIEGADGSAIAGEVRRFMTATQAPALAALLAITVLSVLCGTSLTKWVAWGLPAACILFLAFTRNSLVAVATAIIAALVVRAHQAALFRVLKAAFIAVTAILSLVIVIQLTGTSIGAGWIADQFEAYGSRVINGLTLGGADKSLGARLAENTQLWIAIREAPVLGHGFGYAYQPAFGRPDSFTATFGPYYAHNVYLWLVAKTGVVGLVGFLGFVSVPIIRGLRSPSPEAKTGAIVAAIILAVGVIAPVMEDEVGAVALGIALGAAMTFGATPAVRSTSETTEHFLPPNTVEVARLESIAPGAQPFAGTTHAVAPPLVK